MVKLVTGGLLALLACVLADAQRGIRVVPIVPRKQVALVIGNGAYARLGRLANPVNDANAVARRLGELNFDVLLLKDGARRAMGQRIDEFIGRLGTGDVALFYYAGHGMQVEGDNYLIPTDFEGQTETDVRWDAVQLGKIQNSMERSGAQLNILVLDACRNNPFLLSGRSATRGWAPMNAGRGTFIAFATAPGSVADDNIGANNGLFTAHLLEALSAPDLGLNEVFDYVRAQVDSVSRGRQLPWTHSSVVGRYVFVPGVAATAPAPMPAAPAAGTNPAPGSDTVNSIDGLRYVYIPPGNFEMGCSPSDSQCYPSEKPPRRVTISKGLWIGRTEVTVAAYRKFAQTAGPDDHPKTNVTWNDAAAYCKWAGGRLPTEAEWEYAARAGSREARYGEPDRIAWNSDNSGLATHAVAQKAPNQLGLYDTLGNVWEWCSDWFDPDYYAERRNPYLIQPYLNPKGPSMGQSRVWRGGSWANNAQGTRVSFRGRDPAEYREGGSGFRCVRDVAP